MTSAIKFDQVSKVYRLGEYRHTLRDTFVNVGRIFNPNARKKAQSMYWALKDVSFELDRGVSLGIIGRNGAGKTTILKLLSKITKPTSGHITVQGRLSALIELGAGFHPDLTGRENISLNAAILGLTRSEMAKKFDSIIAFSGLERFIDTPVKRYSSGMYVRLGFSVAAHVEPEVLLVDEVLAVGDAQFRLRCAERIRDLRQLGTTIVFISHNLPLVRSVCDQGIYLDQGVVEARGDMIDVISAYETDQFQKQLEAQKTVKREEGAYLGTRAVEILNVEVKPVDLQPEEPYDYSTPIEYSSPLEVRVNVIARERLKDPNLVLRFVRADGVVCSMVRTADHGCKLDSMDGAGVISVAVDPLQLNSGAYVVEARILGELDGVPLAGKHSRWFQVTGLGQGHGDTGGIFIPQISWARVEHENQPVSSIDR